MFIAPSPRINIILALSLVSFQEILASPVGFNDWECFVPLFCSFPASISSSNLDEVRDTCIYCISCYFWSLGKCSWLMYLIDTHDRRANTSADRALGLTDKTSKFDLWITFDPMKEKSFYFAGCRENMIGGRLLCIDWFQYTTYVINLRTKLTRRKSESSDYDCFPRKETFTIGFHFTPLYFIKGFRNDSILCSSFVYLNDTPPVASGRRVQKYSASPSGKNYLASW